MSRRRNRADAVADQLERVAAELRDGDATLYGYRVKRDPPVSERGGVVYSDGWLTFEFEER